MVFNRLLQSAQVGVAAAVATYRQQDMIPSLEFGWDTWSSRLNRYAVYQAYDDNTIFSSLHTFAAVMIEDQKLYRAIRGVYNPVSRQKQVLTANIYQGSINRQYPKLGALPFVYDNASLESGLKALIKWSNFEVQLRKLMESCVVQGDSYLRVVDEPESRRVRLEALDPAKVREIRLDAVGNTEACVLEYRISDQKPIEERISDPSWLMGVNSAELAQYRVFRMVMTRDRFYTFLDDKAVDSWDNPYPFVPIRLISFSPGKGIFGKNAFYNTLDKINAVNHFASLLLDQVAKIVIPILKARGIRKGNLTIDVSNKVNVPILHIDDPDADVEPLVTNLSLADARTLLMDALEELENDMPELVFAKAIRRNERITEPGMEKATEPATGRVLAARQSIDPGIAAVFQMALTIGGMRGYTDFSGINEATYDAGNMELSIADRPVAPHSITPTERIRMYPGIAKLPENYQRKALADIGLTPPEIEALVTPPPADQPDPATRDELASARERLSLDGFSDLVADEDDDGGSETTRR